MPDVRFWRIWNTAVLIAALLLFIKSNYWDYGIYEPKQLTGLKLKILGTSSHAGVGARAEPFPSEWKNHATKTFDLLRKNSNYSATPEALRDAWDRIEYGYLVRVETSPEFQLHWLSKRGGGGPNDMCRFLDALCHQDYRGSFDFIFNTADEPMGVEELPFPVFSWVKMVTNTDILVPYHITFHTVSDNGCNEDLDTKRWSEKIPVGIWRGSTTGAVFTNDNFRDYPRPKLVKYCHEHPSLCDAQISAYLQGAEHFPEIKKELGPTGSLPMEEIAKFKYVLVLDGNSAPSSRMKHHLQQDSLILKQQSPFIEFFYPSLYPYFHYLPIAFNLSDVGEVIQWARNHDAEAWHMVQNARRFSCEHLTRQKIEEYMKYVFRQYKDLYDGIRVPNVDTSEMEHVSHVSRSQCPDVSPTCSLFQ